jgi:hypothetical protein
MQKPPRKSGSAWGSAVGAVLLSLFAYPGSGHMLYKAKLRGLMWAIAFTIPMLGAFGSFFVKVSSVYNQVTTTGSLDAINLKAMMPRMSSVLLTTLIWGGAALDVLWIALRSQAANPDPPAELGVDEQLWAAHPQVDFAAGRASQNHHHGTGGKAKVAKIFWCALGAEHGRDDLKLAVREIQVGISSNDSLGAGNGGAVGVDCGSSEGDVNALFQLFGDKVLEALCFSVNSFAREPQRLSEIKLEKAVMADHFQSDASPNFSELHTAIRLVNDEARLCQPFQHAGDGGWSHGQVVGQ